MQKNRTEFEAIMKKRILELKGCQDVVRSEIRKEEEECYQQRRELQENADKLEKLKTRYDVLMNALGISGDTINSQADCFTKVEEEKRLLKMKKDELLEKVLRSEDELQALRNTVWVIRLSIEQCHQALKPELTDEQKEEKRLEKELQSIELDIRDVCDRIEDNNKEISELKENLDEMEQKKKELEQMIKEKQNENEAACNEVERQKEKIRRADKTISRLSVGVPQEVKDDMRVRLLRELRNTAIEMLLVAIRDKPKLFDQVKTILEEAGLPMPASYSRLSLRLPTMKSILSQRDSSISSSAQSSSRPTTRETSSVGSIRSYSSQDERESETTFQSEM